MVGIVVVSHSRALAYAAVELAKEMVHDRPVTIEVAAGLDETTFGTDAAAIAATVERGPHADAAGSRAETSATFVITNPHGLHARPAARLVAAVRAFDAQVEMRNRSAESPWISASSLSRVATLGAVHGHEIEVRASGSQAQEAVDTVVTLASRAVDETAIEPEPRQPAKDADATGQPASPGVGIGPAWFAHPAPLEIPDIPAGGPEVGWRRIEEALAAVRADIQRLRDAGGPAADVFDAHLMLLDDPDLLGDVRLRIEHHSPAPQAWTQASRRLRERPRRP